MHPEPLSFLKESAKGTIMGRVMLVVYDENSLNYDESSWKLLLERVWGKATF
jgi:hypothetical protein